MYRTTESTARHVYGQPCPTATAMRPACDMRCQECARPARPGAGVGRRFHEASSALVGVVARHWAKFTSFSVIGAGVFAMGISVQIVLVRFVHVEPVPAYLAQGIVSIEVSFLANFHWTWRDVDTSFWPCGLRFNAQKVLLTIPNMLIYAGLVWVGMNYLLANTSVTGIFTVINYVMGDRWAFTPARRQA
jgi:putative flippase GtrA